MNRCPDCGLGVGDRIRVFRNGTYPEELEGEVTAFYPDWKYVQVKGAWNDGRGVESGEFYCLCGNSRQHFWKKEVLSPQLELFKEDKWRS